MNKDVIYIEPEDDITDIITKIENSKEKIVALVPPKKAGVFRSIVNIKLITKAGKNAEKTIVLVTTDPSIIKLAAATKLPVTKNLQSAPVMPKVDEGAGEEPTAKEDLIETTNEDGTENVEAKESEAESNEPQNDAEDSEDENTENEKDEEETDDKKGKDRKQSSKNKIIDWIKNHKKISITCGVGLLVLIVLAVWAFIIAPAATVTVGVRTVENNFSQSVTFTKTLSEENVNEGKFYLEEKKIETKNEIEFEATGKKNLGEKAHGEVMVVAKIGYRGGTKVVSAGDLFTVNGLSFVADNSITMNYDGDDYSVCSNIDENTPIGVIQNEGCRIYAKVKVTASEAGSKYNISAIESGWNTTADVAVYSDSPMSGGTDQEITVVQQSDINKAKENLSTADESENKEKLFETIGSDNFVIESSFEQSVGSAVSTPAVDEEAKDGKAKLSVITTVSVFVIDKTKVEEFISEKAKLADNYKIYEIKNPFIENFVDTGAGYTGKLKTSYVSGPKVTENDIVEIIKGKGLGVVQHDLKEIDGVGTIKIDTSYPWVMSIPNDPNKITVIIEVEE